MITHRRWTVALAAAASIVMAVPLLLRGTPDVESYTMSIFSTMAFVGNLSAGIDPWFVSGYGFGIPLPSSSWLIKFPPAIPAALFGSDALYGAVWIGGEFIFGLYLLRLTGVITRHRGIAVVVLVTGLLSFSNLGTTYVDDWPEHFLGWAFFPASLWYMLQTVLADSARERVRRAAICGLVLGIHVGSTHQNEIVTFFSGMALVLALLVRTRASGVVAVAAASCVALASALDVLLPTLRGMLDGGVNPLVKRIAVEPDDLSFASYGVFLEPGRAMLAGGLGNVLGAHYERAPFFGLIVLVLAAIGAARLVGNRAPATAFPKDVSRAIGFGFIAYSALTLLPSWVALGLPRMWLYRDGQTVFALLSAAVAMDWMRERHPKLLRPAMIIQVVQVALVASPMVLRVLGAGDGPRQFLFGYARQEHVLFDGLRQAGVGGTSRVMLAGGLERLVRGRMPSSGVTAATDFPLEGIAVVNAWYRGAATPELGSKAIVGRYGNFETMISWNELKHLTGASLDVLGISHVLTLAGDPDTTDWIASLGLTRVTAIDLPDGRQVDVFRNDDGWPRVVLLNGEGALPVPPPRDDCLAGGVFCRDYRALSDNPRNTVETAWHGASAEVILPPDHPGGRLFISEVVGPTATALVDGRARAVRPFLDTFGTVDIHPNERLVTISVANRDRRMLTLVGVALLGGCLVVAAIAGRSASGRRIESRVIF